MKLAAIFLKPLKDEVGSHILEAHLRMKLVAIFLKPLKDEVGSHIPEASNFFSPVTSAKKYEVVISILQFLFYSL